MNWSHIAPTAPDTLGTNTTCNLCCLIDFKLLRFLVHATLLRLFTELLLGAGGGGGVNPLYPSYKSSYLSQVHVCASHITCLE